MYKVLFTKLAQKDAVKIKHSNLEKRCQYLLDLISLDPFAIQPPFEKLIGELQSLYSRRINNQHRLVYAVNEENKIVKVLRMGHIMNNCSIGQVQNNKR